MGCTQWRERGMQLLRKTTMTPKAFFPTSFTRNSHLNSYRYLSPSFHRGLSRAQPSARKRERRGE